MIIYVYVYIFIYTNRYIHIYVMKQWLRGACPACSTMEIASVLSSSSFCAMCAIGRGRAVQAYPYCWPSSCQGLPVFLVFLVLPAAHRHMCWNSYSQLLFWVNSFCCALLEGCWGSCLKTWQFSRGFWGVPLEKQCTDPPKYLSSWNTMQCNIR